MPGQERKKALVLSGGGGRGAYHVGVLRFLEEHEWVPDIVVGTSIGAVNGAAIASGAAPVPLHTYCASVSEQSLTKQHPTQDDLERAFTDLLINKNMLKRLGPAVNSGRGLFLFGAPGNGKTSIAERITRSFGDTIWIPRAISIDGEIIRLFDPSNHQIAPLEKEDGIFQNINVDRRWIRIHRPTIIAGGLKHARPGSSINPPTGNHHVPNQSLLRRQCDLAAGLRHHSAP